MLYLDSHIINTLIKFLNSDNIIVIIYIRYREFTIPSMIIINKLYDEMYFIVYP